MICILVIAVTVAVVSGNPIPPCSEIIDTMSKCLTDNGLDTSEFTKYSQGGIFDPETIKKQCSQSAQYIQAYQCIVSEYTRCSFEAVHLPSADQAAQSMGLVCNDPSIKFDCISQFPRQSVQVQSCITAHSGNTGNQTQTVQQISCESAKTGSQCLIDLVTKCDAHTGNVVAQLTQLTASAVCGGPVTR